MTMGGVQGVHFAVWAPNAQRVSVIGDFNRWDGRAHVMRQLIPSGVWEIFIPDLPTATPYKSEVRTHAGHLLQKADPFARLFEVPPNSASVIWSDGGYHWGDGDWIMRSRVVRRLARSADVDLRGASRLLAARAGGGLPLAHVSRAGGDAGAVRP